MHRVWIVVEFDREWADAKQVVAVFKRQGDADRDAGLRYEQGRGWSNKEYRVEVHQVQ